MIERLIQANYHKLWFFQDKSVRAFREGKDILIKAPTGAGKTLIPLICATLVLGEKLRCVFLVPTRRLIDQTYDQLEDWFKSLPRYQKKYRIVKVTGDERPSHREIKRANIIVTTYESFNGLLSKQYEYALLKKVGLVIVDEMHYISDAERGGRLEDAIVKAKLWLRRRPQMIYLAATLGNAEEIGEWLKAEVIQTTKRHSKIIVGTPIKVYDEYERLETIFRLIKETYELEVGAKETDKRCVLIFCRRRQDTELRAWELTKKCEDMCYKLTVSYSHAGLKAIERQRRMKSFRKGEIDVLFTTTEYREGIDAPVLRIIIADTEVFDSLELEQMIGRAARPRFFEIGYANLIIQGNVNVILSKNEISIENGAIQFKEKPLKSQAKRYLSGIILNRVARGAVSTGQLIRYLKEFYFYYEEKRRISNWNRLLHTAISKQEVFILTKENDKKLFSLINGNERYRREDKANFQLFVKGFLSHVFEAVKVRKKRTKRKKKYKLESEVVCDLLKEYSHIEHKRSEKRLKEQVKIHLLYLIHAGFLERKYNKVDAIKSGKYRATDEGRWASQFLLRVNDALKIHQFFQTRRFYSDDDTFEKLANLIGERVCEHDNERYGVKQYSGFIKFLVLGFDLDEAAKKTGIRLGDAEGCRKTATWMAEAMQAYVEMNIPFIIPVAKSIVESLTLRERDDPRKKVRRYVKEKAPPYPGIQEAINAVLEQGRIVTYDDLHEVITDRYGDSIARITTIRNVLDLAVHGKLVKFSRGKGVGRPLSQVCSTKAQIPEYFHKTCGSCVFRITITDESEKEHENQRYICELRRDYNKHTKTNTLSSYVTQKYGACRYHNSSRKRKLRSIKSLKAINALEAICHICQAAVVQIPQTYNRYTRCPNCDSEYYYRWDGRINVKPGVGDLLQDALKDILGKVVKPTKIWQKREGDIQRHYMKLIIKKGENAYVNQNKLFYIPKEGKARSYLLDAIHFIGVCDGVKLKQQVYNKLGDRIFPERHLKKAPRVPSDQYNDVFNFQITDTLKERAERLRRTVEGAHFARIIVTSKKLSNVLLTLQAEKDELLNSRDVERLFFKQMNVVAHTVMHWTGNRDNLLSFEGIGERYAWEGLKLIVKDTALKCGSRTQERHIFSVPFIGMVKARSPFSTGLNAIYRRALQFCRHALYNVGFSWHPGELVLHFQRGKGQRISIGAILDFRELFLPLFRYVYAKACKEREINENDFIRSNTHRGEEIYSLTEKGEEKISKLFERIMNERVYYLNTFMPLHTAIKQCAKSLCNFLLHKSPFSPFICALDEEQFKEISKRFQNIERFCASLGKGPPIPNVFAMA